LSPNDLLRDFSESPVTAAPGQRERLWSKVLSDTPSGCLARFGVNKKTFAVPHLSRLRHWPYRKWKYSVNEYWPHRTEDLR